MYVRRVIRQFLGDGRIRRWSIGCLRQPIPSGGEDGRAGPNNPLRRAPQQRPARKRSREWLGNVASLHHWSPAAKGVSGRCWGLSRGQSS